MSTQIFAPAIRALRDRLGQIEGQKISQDEMARRIGAKVRAYVRWETGQNVPRGDWLIRIMRLCPDEETRANFFVDIGETGSKIRSTPRTEVAKEKEEASRPGAMNDRGRIAPKHYNVGPKGR